MIMQIHTIDLQFQAVSQAIAAYLVVGPEGVVLVETGPGSTLTNLQTGLAQLGYQPGDIKHVLVTHIHLDHAGAAGWWAAQGATIYVHPIGAPHLIDPSKLINSAARIYGDNMDRLWGQIEPAPAEHVLAVANGARLKLAGLTFEAIETAGHASHHYTYRVGDIAFTGDAAGVHLPGSHFLSLPAPPPEFDREKWRETINLLRQERLTTLYPTHFGAVNDPAAHLDALEALLDEATEFVRQRMAEGQDREQIMDAYLNWQKERAAAVGVSDWLAQRYEAANPNFMSVDGIMRYWKKRS
jgi:glyoxylase-like metal-dependent hydrolase (beta-lactamase superfamily II)